MPSKLTKRITYNQGLDFDDMSSPFPCEINDAIQYINLGYVLLSHSLQKLWSINISLPLSS